ncbi:MAG: PAS domain-containing protein [Candidatus Eremiobacteraeota bacterium]|nr:PAS domain-containing protein [Candidatus Eremiobacteraeota bacterium]MCW5867221.1 PAS domain-containing protein [Candidatus Eremiobacteraeota bacterium]
MKLRPLIYACLLLPTVAGWMGADVVHQVFLLVALAIVLETTVLRPLFRLTERAKRLEVHSGSGTVFEVSALDRAIARLESRFDQRLQESEREKQQIRNLLSALPDPVLYYDREDRLLFLNPAAELALELHRQDLIGRSLAANWTDLLRPPESPRQQQPPVLSFEKPGKVLMEKVLEAQESGQDTFEIGAKRTYRSQIIPMRSQERVLVLRDITDLKRLEEVRQLFLSSISHELRTPLTIIKGFAVTLLDHPEIPDDFCKPLQKVDREADRLTRLVNDLLDLSQIQSRRLSIEVMPFDARELLEETLSLMAPLAERRVVDLQFNGDSQLPDDLFGDRDRLKQVLINLLDNAIKFTPGGGKVSVSTVTTGTIWEINVTDTGPGVSESDLPNLFEHFFRGKHSRKFAGSGLGLAIVKEIVELHQGSVEAFCPANSGLHVRVRLPRHQSP